MSAHVADGLLFVRIEVATAALDPAAIREIAELLDLAPAEVYDAMTFYGFFREESKPLGRTRLWVCRSLACGSGKTGRVSAVT